MSGAEATPRQPTEEASREGLRLASAAGDAYRRMVEYFVAHVAKTGALQESGDYRIGIAIEDPEPLYEPSAGELRLCQPPRGSNAHLEVVVLDARDGRFVPGLAVRMTLVRDADELGSWDLPFLWHPTMYHYGRNVRVAQPGRCTAVVTVEVPTFGRHDEVHGLVYQAPARVVFENISVAGS